MTPDTTEQGQEPKGVFPDLTAELADVLGRLVDEDVCYDENEIRIRCEHHGDAISRMYQARLVLARARDWSGPSTAELVEALRPFALAAEDLDQDGDGYSIWESPAAVNLTAGDLRRALAAYVRATGGEPS